MHVLDETKLQSRGNWPGLVVNEKTEQIRAFVAIVGSRRPTPYGEAIAERLAADLAAQDVVIVSGLARGIDAAAHRGALDAGGLTVAVLGTGVDVIYPAENAELAERILAGGGALLSQFPDGSPPRRSNFPQRNWTVAQISDGVIVIEAAEGGGTLITAEAAITLGKELMAVPGSVFSPLSVGPHNLIRDHQATLVYSARQVLYALNIPSA